MPINPLTTTKSTIYTGGRAETYAITNTDPANSVDIYVNGEATASITIPPNSLQYVRRIESDGIFKVEAAAVAGTASVTHGICVK